MDYPCHNFGDFSFSRFGFIVRQTDRQNHTHTDAGDRYTDATPVGVCDYGAARWTALMNPRCAAAQSNTVKLFV